MPSSAATVRSGCCSRSWGEAGKILRGLDGTRRRGELGGEQFHQRGLAGTVVPHHPETDGRNGQGDIVEQRCGDPEGEADVGEDEG